MNYFITGIDTDSGKTLVSAIVCEALQADYWKPIQAGYPRDSDTIKDLVTSEINIHPEGYLLKTPASPHAAAKLDGVHIAVKNLTLPVFKNHLVIEGAGGCLVPLNDEEFVIDLVRHFDAHAILVADLYLGSINHTLLTVEALHRRSIVVKGIIFNGDSNPESERIILHHAKLPCLLRIKKEPFIDKEIIRTYATELNKNWHG
jgi:dethiobiotin synthetase